MVSDGESYREKIVARAWDDETKIAVFDGFGCSLVNSLFLALYFYFQHVVHISMLMLNLILNEVDPLLVK
jgi:hypothetical protein